MLGELNLAELAWEGGGGVSGAPPTPPREWLETALSGAPAAAAAYDYCIIPVREGGALQISSLVYLFVKGVCQGSFFDFSETQGQMQIKEASLCLHLICFLPCRLQSGVLFLKLSSHLLVALLLILSSAALDLFCLVRWKGANYVE